MKAPRGNRSKGRCCSAVGLEPGVTEEAGGRTNPQCGRSAVLVCWLNLAHCSLLIKKVLLQLGCLPQLVSSPQESGEQKDWHVPTGPAEPCPRVLTL